MPWRLAVDDIARGVCRLSNTIRSFSSSDQRRRRPVSTTSKPLNLSTVLMAVHKDCYSAIDLTQQGGPHRRETAKTKSLRPTCAAGYGRPPPLD